MGSCIIPGAVVAYKKIKSCNFFAFVIIQVDQERKEIKFLITETKGKKNNFFIMVSCKTMQECMFDLSQKLGTGLDMETLKKRKNFYELAKYEYGNDMIKCIILDISGQEIIKPDTEEFTGFKWVKHADFLDQEGEISLQDFNHEALSLGMLAEVSEFLSENLFTDEEFDNLDSNMTSARL
jgi:hypothetical protein